ATDTVLNTFTYTFGNTRIYQAEFSPINPNHLYLIEVGGGAGLIAIYDWTTGTLVTSFAKPPSAAVGFRHKPNTNEIWIASASGIINILDCTTNTLTQISASSEVRFGTAVNFYNYARN